MKYKIEYYIILYYIIRLKYFKNSKMIFNINSKEHPKMLMNKPINSKEHKPYYNKKLVKSDKSN